MSFFNEILYRPLFNLVVFLYNVIPGSDFGLAILAMTVLIRLAFLPLTIKTTRSQKALNDLAPKIKELKEKHKSDMAAQSAAVMKLYKDNNVNPVAGCLPLLIQLPILFALYQAFMAGLKPESLSLLYSFISNPGQINNISFGFIDITHPNHPLVIISGVLQFLQMKQSVAVTGSANKEAAAMNKQMLYFFPIIIIIIGWNFPAGLMIYWTASTLLSLAEQTFIKRS